MHQEQFEVLALSEGPPVEFAIPWLQPPRAAPEAASEAGTAPAAAAEVLPAPAAAEGTETPATEGPGDLPLEEPPARG
jgi:hypothetical protein